MSLCQGLLQIIKFICIIFVTRVPSQMIKFLKYFLK